MRTQNEYKIYPLTKEQWKDAPIPLAYTTNEYYDVIQSCSSSGIQVEFIKKALKEPISHFPEEYDFPDRLYQNHWENAYAWGVVEEENGEPKLAACIETCPEPWSNRLRITELWVHENLRRQGLGHALMEIAKQQAHLEHRRAIILETQTCNVPAINFYFQEGFEVIGFDRCCYSNQDIERREVRLELGYFPRKYTLKKEQITIREESPDEYKKVEEITLHAFWNKHHMGCDEHLLVHKLRMSDDYLPQLSRVAVVQGEIVGVICYARAKLLAGTKTKKIITFGPLCVLPEWQGSGIGKALLETTLDLAKQAGFEGVVIFGEPDYYPCHGFQTCEHFGITTIDGKNSEAFLGRELVNGGLSAFGGKFLEPEVYENLSEEENEIYTKEFQAPPKQKFPCQWD